MDKNNVWVDTKPATGILLLMKKELREKALTVCADKIAKKGTGVGISFYAFFKNQNDNPELLMEAATWWIKKHKLDHFEKAEKIRKLILSE